MVRHIVFIKLEDKSAINEAKERLLGMKKKIEYLKNIEVGINFSKEERAYDLALITDFDSKDDLEKYAVDEDHLEVLKFLKSKGVKSKVVDYEY